MGDGRSKPDKRNMRFAAQQAEILGSWEYEREAVIDLSGYSVVEVKGADAANFLQAQTMNDVAALAPQRWQWNGLLNPKGRVLFLFCLARLAPDRFWLVQAVGRGVALATHLARFRFRSKVEIAERPEIAAAGSIDPSSGIEAGSVLASGDSEFQLGLEPFRRGVLHLAGARPADAVQDAEAWHRHDLMAGIPRIREEVAGAFTPQMLGLDRLRAYSVKKGCYPGQEIVARTHFLGSAKRHPALLRVESLPAAGVSLRDGEGAALGDVVDGVSVGDEKLVFCVLRREADEAESMHTDHGLATVVVIW